MKGEWRGGRMMERGIEEKDAWSSWMIRAGDKLKIKTRKKNSLSRTSNSVKIFIFALDNTKRGKKKKIPLFRNLTSGLQMLSFLSLFLSFSHKHNDRSYPTNLVNRVGAQTQVNAVAQSACRGKEKKKLSAKDHRQEQHEQSQFA